MMSDIHNIKMNLSNMCNGKDYYRIVGNCGILCCRDGNASFTRGWLPVEGGRVSADGRVYACL